MDSDLRIPHHSSPNNQQHNLQQQQQQQMNSGLMRYRSAPSSYFTNILNSVGVDVDVDDDCNEFLNPGPSSPIFDLVPKNLFENQQNSSENQAIQSQFMASMKHEAEFLQQSQQQQQSTDYSSASQMIYQTQSQPKHTLATSSSVMDNSDRVSSSMAMEMENFPQMKMGGGTNSNLIRHSSSPAGLFSHINVENGRLKGQTNFSSGLMTHSSGMEGKSTGLSESDDGSFSRDPGGYITGFPVGSWDDSAIMSDNFLKRLGDDNRNTLENQSVEGGNRPPTILSHHLSLPKTSAELSAMEKLLELQDSVPCKIRAKRGFATHPRSIAERVRRTRISERMRKLQELVPNMDKQTNTADMLDLAVDYIKDLQKHVKTLSDNRAKCTCSDQQKR